MSLGRAIREKPWLRPSGQRPETLEPRGLANLSSHKIGLTLFLVVVASFFMLFTISYQLRMDYPDWRPSPEPWQLWANTFLLLLGSITLQLSRMAAASGNEAAMKRALLLSGVFTFAFLAGQLWAWQVMASTGYHIRINPANSFFYLITGVHGVHMLGGMVAWLRTMLKVNRGDSAESVRLSVELCTTYWHVLFVIWIFLFYMLLVT